jgi:hypothetical protein
MTDRYPRGKLSHDDEGQLPIKIGVKDRTVIIDFGKEVAWIGMSGDQAAEFAMMILKRAREAGLSKPLTVTL